MQTPQQPITTPTKNVHYNPNVPNIGKRWSPEESARLVEAYTKGLDINEIAKVHGRNPLGIATKLVSLKIIVSVTEARGAPQPDPEFDTFKLLAKIKKLEESHKESCKELHATHDNLRIELENMRLENLAMKRELSAIKFLNAVDQPLKIEMPQQPVLITTGTDGVRTNSHLRYEYPYPNPLQINTNTNSYLQSDNRPYPMISNNTQSRAYTTPFPFGYKHGKTQ